MPFIPLDLYSLISTLQKSLLVGSQSTCSLQILADAIRSCKRSLSRLVVWPDWAILQDLGSIFFTKVAWLSGNILGYFWKRHFFNKNSFGNFLDINVWQQSATFNFNIRSHYHPHLCQRLYPLYLYLFVR